MDAETLLGLHTNQRLLLQELQARGVELELLVPELELVEARFQGRVELLLDRDSSLCPYSASVIAGNKYLSKLLLERAGLPVPAGRQFYPNEKNESEAFAESLGFPVVVKPVHGSHGQGCRTDCMEVGEVREAFAAAAALAGSSGAVLIEEQRPGMEFRIFITKTVEFAVLHREPASVLGDGRSSIAELAAAESFHRMNPRRNCLTPIVLDVAVESFLKRQGLTLKSIPAPGQQIFLRRNSNLALGGSCEDYTSRTHPKLIAGVLRALEVFPGLHYAGIDVLSTAIEKPLSPGSWCILEVNSNPGLHMHMRPARGNPQNVAAYLADIIFPETKRG